MLAQTAEVPCWCALVQALVMELLAAPADGHLHHSATHTIASMPLLNAADVQLRAGAEISTAEAAGWVAEQHRTLQACPGPKFTVPDRGLPKPPAAVGSHASLCCKMCTEVCRILPDMIQRAQLAS